MKNSSCFTKNEGSMACREEFLYIFEGPSFVTDANSGYSGCAVPKFNPNLVKSKPKQIN